MGTSRVGGIRIDLQLGLAELEQGVQKAKKILGTAFAVGGTGLGIAATIKGFDLLSDKLVDLARKGDRLGDLEATFRDLGGSAQWIDKAKESILDTAKSADILSVSNKLLIAGLKPTESQFVALTDYAGRYAQATGGDVKQALEQIGMAIAKGSAQRLEMLGFHTTGETKAQRQAEALAQLQGKVAGLAPITLDVATAADGLDNAWSELSERLGKVVNDNDSLAEGLAAVRDVVKEIDIAPLINSIASLTGEILKATAALLDFLNVVPRLKMIDAYKEADRLANSLAINPRYKRDGRGLGYDEVVRLNREFNALIINGERSAETVAKLEDRLNQLKDAQAFNKERGLGVDVKRSEEILSGMHAQLEQFKLSIQTPTRTTIFDQTGKDAEGARKAIREAEKAVESLNEEYRKFQEGVTRKGLDDEIQRALDAGDMGKLTELKERLRVAVRDGVLAGLDESVRGSDTAAQYADSVAAEQVKVIDQEIAEALKEAHKKAVDFWRNTFENAITGVKFDLEDALKQVAVGFAAEIMAGITGSFGGGMGSITSPQDMGSAIAKIVMSGGGDGGGGFLSSLGSGGGSFLSGLFGGQGVSGAGDYLSGMWSGARGNVYPAASGAEYSGMQAGASLAKAAPYAAVAYAGYTNFDKISKAFHGDREANFEAGMTAGMTAVGGVVGSIIPGLGTAIGAAIGAAVGKYGGEAMSKAFGIGGPSNKETLARNQFEKFIQDSLAEKDISLLNPATNRLEHIRGLDFKTGGSDAFNDPNWGAGFNALPGKARSVFGALGESMKGLAGITEDVGGQIAMMLAANLGGEIDNARYLVKTLGLEFEDLAAIVEKSAFEGKISWAEHNQQVAGLGESFAPGLEAFAAYGEAWDQFLQEGGKGMGAVVRFQNMIVEAQEAGFKSFDEWKQALLDAGKDPEFVDALFASLAQNGIENFEQLSAATDVQLGKVVGDMELASQKLQTEWKNIRSEIDALAKSLDSLPERVESSVEVGAHIDPALSNLMDFLDMGGGSFKVTMTPMDDGSSEAQAFGTVFTEPTFFRSGRRHGVVGEAGPEILMPLNLFNQRMSGGLRAPRMMPAVNFNIDARGADAGVEERIYSALTAFQEQFLQEAMSSISDYMDR